MFKPVCEVLQQPWQVTLLSNSCSFFSPVTAKHEYMSQRLAHYDTSAVIFWWISKMKCISAHWKYTHRIITHEKVCNPRTTSFIWSDSNCFLLALLRLPDRVLGCICVVVNASKQLIRGSERIGVFSVISKQACRSAFCRQHKHHMKHQKHICKPHSPFLS